MHIYYTSMIKNIRYIKLEEALSRSLRHPLLQSLDLEAAIQYALDFIGMFGMPDVYETKEAEIEIENHRGKLPCDLISINQVTGGCNSQAFRAMTDTFNPVDCGCDIHCREYTYKTQGSVLFTSIKNGKVKISYQAIHVDDNGQPMIIDNSAFLLALDAYIKKEVFTILFDTGKIKGDVLSNAQQDYAWKAGVLQSEFSIPSIDEMEAISNMWCTLIPRTTEFDNGFKTLGRREYIRRH